MNWRAVRAIASKDLRMVIRSRAVSMPIVIVPLVILLILPLIYALASQYAIPVNVALGNMGSLNSLMQNMPDGLKAELAVYSENQRVVALALTYFIAPLYLIVPLMVSTVIAADSLAGERERKTLEALVYTPTTDMELFVAKLLAAWLPALAVGILGFVVYGIAANLAAWPLMGRVFFPNLMWVVLAFWVGPAAAGLGLGASVLVSARVATFQEANQLGGMVVLPVILLVVGQTTGVMYFSTGLVALLGLVLWLIDAVLIYFGQRLFRRGQILARG